MILDGWGCAPPGPGERRRARRHAGLRPALAPSTRTRGSARRARPSACRPGQMGNSRGRAPDDRLGPRALPGPACGSTARSPTARFFANAGARGRVRAGAGARRDVHLLGLVSHGGVHSHLDHLHALLELAAQGDGRADVDPRLHRRPRRLATRRRGTTSRSCRPSGSRPSSAATTRWTATSAGTAPSARFAAIVAGEGRRAADPLAAVRESYEEGVTDEFVEPVVARRPAAPRRRETRRSSSTSARTAPASSRRSCSRPAST